MNKLTPRVALEVASHEAIVRQTYYDTRGVPTWCVGMTSATGHDVNRYWNNPQPLQKCVELYVWALDNYADVVRKVFKDYELTEAQFAAILSFTWNLGGPRLKGASWVKYFKAGDMKEAERRFMLWNKPSVIVRRRKLEADLLFRGIWNNDGTMVEYTRLTKTKEPSLASAKRIDILHIVVEALKRHEKVELSDITYAEEIDPPITLTPTGMPKPKPRHKMTTNYTAIGSFITTVVAALSSLDTYIAVLLIIIAAGFAIWIVRERINKNEEFGA